jgi:hypothetical protein
LAERRALGKSDTMKNRKPAMSPVVYGIATLVAVALAVFFLVRRALTVLVVDLHAGRVVAKRGRAMPELLREIGDVAQRAKCTGRVTLRLEGGQVAVRTEGLGDATTQQLRNVVGRFPKARLTQAPRL